MKEQGAFTHEQIDHYLRKNVTERSKDFCLLLERIEQLEERVKKLEDRIEGLLIIR